jgi:hypothetical protein
VKHLFPVKQYNRLGKERKMIRLVCISNYLQVLI